MNTESITRPIKRALGRLPWTAELYQRMGLRQGPPRGGYHLDELEQALPGWLRALAGAVPQDDTAGGKRVLVVGSLSWWLENTTALALLLRRAGHSVDLAFLPYRRWSELQLRFDARRQRAYLRRALSPLEPWVRPVDLLELPRIDIDPSLAAALDRQTELDVQYTLQREDVTPEEGGQVGALYELRRQRNTDAAACALTLLRQRDYDVAIIPNGSILEFGALRRAAEHEGLAYTTYEYGEQRNRLWLAQNGEVMRLDTSDLWQARGDVPLSKAEEADLETLYRARQGGEVWQTFARRWQAGESQGAQAARRELGLDPDKPVVLLCTNVVGDSMALDRQVFTQGMADWLRASVRHLAQRPEVQLVVRVHPGELLGAGHPSAEIVRRAAPQVPDHVRLVPPGSEINTYDLIGLADLGLVYTTTVGMEMAMSGVPVIVAGQTHYRDKGFTVQPDSMQEYLDAIDVHLAEPAERRLPERQVELARRYAYRFFFEFPFAYPWHVINFWDDIERRPLPQIMGSDRLSEYGRTLAAMVGGEIDWSRRGRPARQAVSG